MPHSRLILASASPRRKELLQSAGYVFEVMPSTVPETINPNLTPEINVEKISLDKARDVASRMKDQKGIILAADTIVLLDQRILGKPRDEKEAASFLNLLSGRTHRVLTGYTIISTPDRILNQGHGESKVTMKILNPSDIKAYVESGEPMDKAGAYAAQGLGNKLIKKIEGSMSNVIGLPIEMVGPALSAIL